MRLFGKSDDLKMKEAVLESERIHCFTEPAGERALKILKEEVDRYVDFVLGSDKIDAVEKVGIVKGARWVLSQPSALLQENDITLRKFRSQIEMRETIKKTAEMR